jgi:hypothetical protein
VQIAAAAIALGIAVSPAAVDRVAPAPLAAGPAEATHGPVVRADRRASEDHVVAEVVLEVGVAEDGVAEQC